MDDGCGPGATCWDSVQNQGETGVDCGGPCPTCGPSCPDGSCDAGEDCTWCSDCYSPLMGGFCDNGESGVCYDSGNYDSCGNCPVGSGGGSPEVCNGLDDDCDGQVDEGLSFDVDGDGHTTPGSCLGTRDDCDDTNPAMYPGNTEVCDGVDNDCDGLIDEGVGVGFCEGSPYDINCNGEIACGGYGRDACPVGVGCVRNPGQCEISRYLCYSDAGCPGSETCVGGNCTGYVSCTQFDVEGDCNGYGVCGWDGCDSYNDRTSCDNDAECSFSCTDNQPEICSNGADDDGDGDVDCEDSECQVTVGLTQTEVDERYNCLGTDQTGDVVRSWYCGVNPVIDASVGLCCPSGEWPYQLFGDWQCTSNNPCDPTNDLYNCYYDYQSEFSDWITSVGTSSDATWCVSPTEQRACCSVVHFGSSSYWDDEATDNVKVY